MVEFETYCSTNGGITKRDGCQSSVAFSVGGDGSNGALTNAGWGWAVMSFQSCGEMSLRGICECAMMIECEGSA